MITGTRFPLLDMYSIIDTYIGIKKNWQFGETWI